MWKRPGRDTEREREIGKSSVKSHQGLLNEEAKEDGIANLSQALKYIRLQLSILNDVLQLVVEEFQDAWKNA